jgi:hypothetical protein
MGTGRYEERAGAGGGRSESEGGRAELWKGHGVGWGGRGEEEWVDELDHDVGNFGVGHAETVGGVARGVSHAMAAVAAVAKERRAAYD